MAKRIQGITIEIDGNTQPLENALKSVNKEINAVEKDLKNVDQALKLNPGDAEQVARKLELLAEKAELSQKKVDALKQAQAKMEASGVEKSSKAYKDLQTELSKAESELRSLSTEMERTEKSSQEVADGQKLLSTYLEATGQTADDLVSIIGSKLVDAYKSGQLGAAGYERALQEIAKESTGSKGNVEALKDVLKSFDQGSSIESVADQITLLGDKSKNAKTDVSALAADFVEFGKELSTIDDDLKRVDEALKLDPSSVENLTAKQELLSKAVDNSEQELTQLKQAYTTLTPGDIGQDKFEALGAEISRTEQRLTSYRGELSSANQALMATDTSLSGLSSELKTVNENLKFDTTGIDGLKQKQDILTQAVTETESKVSSLSAEIKTIDPQTDLGKEKFTALNQELAQTETQLNGYKTELNSTTAELNTFTQNQQRLSTFFEATKTSASQFAHVLGSELVSALNAGKADASQLETAINKIGAECTGSTAHVDRFKQALDSIDSGVSLEGIRADISKIGQESDSTKVEVDGLAEELSSLSGKVDLSNVLEGVDGITDGLEGASEKLQEFGAKGLEAAETVQGAQSTLQVKFGETAEQAEVTGEHARAVWADNFGGSLDEVANTMGLVKQSIEGVNDSNIEDITAKFQTLVDYGNDEQEVVRAVNSVMQAFSVDADEALDIVTKGFQEIPSDELADNLAEYSPLFQQVGLDAGEMLTVLDEGMNKGAYSTDKCADTIKEMGIRMNDGSIAQACQDLGGNFSSLYETMSAGGASQSEIFRALVGEIGNLGTEEEKVAATSALFGTQGEDSGYKVVQAMAAATNQTMEYGGAADQAKTANENSVGAMQRKWEDLLLKLAPVGEKLAEIAGTIIDQVSPAIQGLCDWFTNLSPGMQTTIVAIGGIVAALATIGPAVLAIAGAFTSGLGPVIGVMAAVAAAVAAVIAVIANWDSITKAISETWNAFCAGVTQAFTEMGQGVQDMWNQITSWFSDIGSSIAQTWSDFCTGISDRWNEIWSAVQTKWDETVSWFQSIFSGISSTVGDAWNSFCKGFNEKWDNIWSTIESGWNGIKSWFNGAFDGIKKDITQKWDAMCSTVSKTWNEFTANIQKIWNTAKENVTKKVEEFKNNVQQKFSQFRDQATQIWDNIRSNIEQRVDTLKNNAAQKFDELRARASEIFSNIRDTLSGIWDGIVGAVTEKANSIRENVSGAFNETKERALGAWDDLKSRVGQIWEGIKSTVRQGVDKLKSFFNFRWELPKIKLPHFKINGTFSLNPPQVPSFGVQWYKKGGILTTPTIFGSNGDDLLGGGEAGPEAVLPIDNLKKYIRDEIDNSALVDRMDRMIKLLEKNSETQIVMDTGAVVGALTRPIDQALGRERVLSGRR